MLTFCKNNYREFTLILFAFVVLAPVLYFGRPLHLSTPDIKYAKAKVLQINLSTLYADPVTGYNTFHPPYYYLVLAAGRGIGLEVDTTLVMMSILQVLLIIFLSYAVLWGAFGRSTAFMTCLMIPFIVQFMGSQNILLTNSFYFSVPFYLTGLWFYLKMGDNARQPIFAGVFWGLAFLISPVYFFLLGLTFLHELIPKKRCRRFLLMAGAFMVTIIPFYIQAAVIISEHLWGTSAFALWRGWPDAGWLMGMAMAFISPVVHAVTSLPTIIHILILLTSVIVAVKARRVYWFIPLAFLAYVLTYYHFGEQYAVRIQLLFSFFLVAATMERLLAAKRRRLLWHASFGVVILFSLVFYYEVTLSNYQWEKNIYETNLAMTRGLWANAAADFDKGRFVLCTKDTYFDFLAPIVPIHALGAYKTMEYFQLNSRLSDELERDYQTAINGVDYAAIIAIADKYGVRDAVASATDADLHIFKILMAHWTPVYKDKYFLILRRPG